MAGVAGRVAALVAAPAHSTAFYLRKGNHSIVRMGTLMQQSSKPELSVRFRKQRDAVHFEVMETTLHPEALPDMLFLKLRREGVNGRVEGCITPDVEDGQHLRVSCRDGLRFNVGGGDGEHFNLVGVVLRSGGTHSGHYTAAIRRGGRWFLCDDLASAAQPVNNLNATVGSSVYMFVYHRAWTRM